MTAEASPGPAAAAAELYRTAISADWIDYNGHLRDAYYGLIFSEATDSLMDRLGIDAPYRTRTHCTLYTLEMHINYLREVHQSDQVTVGVRLLDSDAKRMLVGMELTTTGGGEPSATAELLLLHVHQGETPATAPFPPDIAQAIERFRAQWPGPLAGPGSRRMELRRRT